MCIIAGYSGNKPAAPILIEMMKKTEYIDGGLSTGIATIHNGRLYMRKVVGDVETLLKETDALNLPGTTGIMHSRPSAYCQSHAHPFLSDDEKLALVLNGTGWGCATQEFCDARNAIMNDFLDRGIKIRSALEQPDGVPKSPRTLKNGLAYHDTEPYALLIGEAVKNSPRETIAGDIVKATAKALETLPIDIVTLNVHANLPDTITIGSISRPMSVGFGDGETYLASVPLAFPEEIQQRPIIFIPPTTVAQATPSGLKICQTHLEGVKVEQIDYRSAKKIREDTERIFSNKKDDPQSIYALPFLTEWDETLWRRPLVEATKYVLENSRLKPIGTAIYEGLWSFHKEGRLHQTLGTVSETNKTKIMKFWIE